MTQHKRTWRDRLTDAKEFLIRRWEANPLLCIMVLIMVFAATTSIGGAYYQAKSDHTASAKLMAIREGNIQEVSLLMEKGALSSIKNYTVYEKETVLDPTLRAIQVFEDKNGKQLRIDSYSLPEEFWKRVTEAGIKKGFLISSGKKYPKDNPIIAFADLLFFYSAIIMVLIFAQTMVGQVISGHTFTADRRDRNILLSDVIGYEDVKREITEVLDKIVYASKYAKDGIKAPRGLLLLGDPGVGKTMMAKAIANELGGDFFYCTGADFAEMYVGVGPRRVRALFKRARKSPRAVIFIDEIDAIGARNSMGNDSERQSTINQMLAEMDGVSGNGNLLVIGATNHANLLDPALRRPGRFDKEIHVPLPDLDTREGILTHYLKDTLMADDVDLKAMALRTQGYSGARLAGLVAEAKNMALRDVSDENALVITQATLENAQERQLLGAGQQKAHPDDLDRVAVHELGHALAGLLVRRDIQVDKITLSGRGQALGYCAWRPLREMTLRTQQDMEGELVMSLAGRAAEQTILGSVSNGAVDDLERATAIARDMVCRFGFGQATGLMVPPRSADPGHLPDSVQQDIQALLNRMYEQALSLVAQHRHWLERHRQTLTGGETDTLGYDVLIQGLQPDSMRVTEVMTHKAVQRHESAVSEQAA